MSKKPWLPNWAWGIIVVVTLTASIALFVFIASLEAWANQGNPNGNSDAIITGITLVVINIVLWFLYARDYKLIKALEVPDGPDVIISPNSRDQESKEK